MDHADPFAHSIARISEADGLPIDPDLARVGVEEAEKDVHQGRLARAIFPEEAVHLALLHGEVDSVIGQEWAEGFGYTGELEPHVPSSPAAWGATCPPGPGDKAPGPGQDKGMALG
jgi:hypothetical protein